MRINFFEFVHRILDKLEDIDALKHFINDSANDIADRMGQALKLASPVGEVEPGFWGIKPSERLGQKAISQSWKMDVLDLPNGVSVQGRNLSEHVMCLIHGTPEHIITKRGLGKKGDNLYFWWGNYGTNKGWGPKKGHEGGPGMRQFLWVDHPGIAPNPFVKNTAMEQRVGIGTAVKSTVEKHVMNVMSSFGLRRSV